jgi:hypothetical protein
LGLNGGRWWIQTESEKCKMKSAKRKVKKT